MSNKRKQLKHLCVVLLAATTIISCKPVKEYQKSRLNDGEMSLGARKAEKTENSFQTYREGASGANGGKTGGGCGCN
jgi:hypothetical protein